MSEWRELKFADLLLEPLRNGIYKKKEFHGRGAKIINMGELFAFPRMFAIPMKRVELVGTEIERFSVKENDLLFARRSLVAEGAGKCNIVLSIDELTTFESSIIRARLNQDFCNSLFYYYYFNSPQGLYKLDTIRRQVAVAGITGRDLAELYVPFPPLSEQKAIAHILGSLDDKIELNRRMNETLEAMARAIFKDWFVDFGPTRAKMEGRAPYLPEPIWSLFPDAIDPQSGLPVGWGEATISKYLDVKRGGSPRPIQDYIVPKGIPWVKIADATSISSPFIFSTKEFIKPEGLKKTVKLNAGNLILSNSATPGLPKFLMLDACIHDGWLYFPKIDKFSKEYLYLLFLSIRQNLVGQGNGSIFTNLKIEIIKNQRIVDPPQTVINLFMSSIPSFFEKMLFTDNESRTLAELRDRL